MKKYIFVSIITVIIPLTALASFDQPLSYGSRGTDVEQLQELLISENCLSAQPTSYFGLLTLAGVKCFQTKYNIPATGYFGNLSRAQANSIVTALVAPSTAEQIAETGTTTPTCPTGLVCTPITSIPATTTCPVGYTCAPHQSLQAQISQIQTTVNQIAQNTPTTAMPVQRNIEISASSFVDSNNASSSYIDVSISDADLVHGVPTGQIANDIFSIEVYEVTGVSGSLISSWPKIGNDLTESDRKVYTCNTSLGDNLECSINVYYRNIPVGNRYRVAVTYNGKLVDTAVMSGSGDNEIIWNGKM